MRNELEEGGNFITALEQAQRSAKSELYVSALCYRRNRFTTHWQVLDAMKH